MVNNSSGDRLPLRPGDSVIGLVDCSATTWMSQALLRSASFSTNNAEAHIQFPMLARSVLVRNLQVSGTAGIGIRVHQTSLSAGNVIGGGHFVPLFNADDSHVFDSLMPGIWVSLISSASDAAYLVVAGLTLFPTSSAPVLTGSGVTE